MSSSVRKKPGSTSIVRIPNGAISGVNDSIQPSRANLAAAYAVQNTCPVMPAVEEIVTTRPERWARRTGNTARVTFSGPNRVVSTWARKSVGRDLLEEPGVEVAGVVDQDVDTAKAVDGGVHRCLGLLGAGDVEFDDQQIVLRTAYGLCDRLGTAAGGDDLRAQRPGRPGQCPRPCRARHP